MIINTIDEMIVESNQYKLILVSNGLNTVVGKHLLQNVFDKEKLEPSSIFLITLSVYNKDDVIIKHCKELGFQNVYKASEYEGECIEKMPQVDFIFVTEGNTFEVVNYIRKNRFDDYIRKQVLKDNAVYIGASAGAIYAASDFGEVKNYKEEKFYYLNNDMTMFTGLNLMPHVDGVGDIALPHYTYKELQTYISNMSEIDKSKYMNIYNVADEEALILDCKRIVYESSEMIRLVRKRRIRL